MRKISQWIDWKSMPHKEKSLYEDFQLITVMSQNAGLPKMLIDDAMVIHKDMRGQKILRGLNRDGMISASIYISCRLNGCPRTSAEIAEIFRLDKTSASNGCSVATTILNNIERSGDTKKVGLSDLCATTPTSFLDRYCSKLNLSQETTILAKFVASRIEKGLLINDNTPNSVAAGIIYFVCTECKIEMNKTNVRKVCGVSEVTINKCFKKLVAMREQLIPSTVQKQK
jgi:transcription initiation factor TFIIB